MDALWVRAKVESRAKEERGEPPRGSVVLQGACLSCRLEPPAGGLRGPCSPHACHAELFWDLEGIACFIDLSSSQPIRTVHSGAKTEEEADPADGLVPAGVGRQLLRLCEARGAASCNRARACMAPRVRNGPVLGSKRPAAASWLSFDRTREVGPQM